MDIKQLTYFISAARHENFTRAAQECFIVQTAMTHQMAALERELGVQLFARSNRRVKLTPAGEVFLGQARRIVQSAEDASLLARAAAEGAKRILMKMCIRDRVLTSPCRPSCPAWLPPASGPCPGRSSHGWIPSPCSSGACYTTAAY